MSIFATVILALIAAGMLMTAVRLVLALTNNFKLGNAATI